MKPVALIGFRGTGKTTVGRRLAKRLELPFVDVDEEIESRTGRRSPEIITLDGLATFRDLEQEVTESLLRQQNLVIACGGGIISRQANRTLLKRRATVVLLTASHRTIHHRLVNDSSRAPWDERISRLGVLLKRARRWRKYTSIASITVRSDSGTPEQIAKTIQTKLSDKR